MKKHNDGYSYKAHQVDLPVTVGEDKVFNLDLQLLSAFALLGKGFKDKTKDKATLQAEAEERQKVYCQK